MKPADGNPVALRLVMEVIISQIHKFGCGSVRDDFLARGIIQSQILPDIRQLKRTAGGDFIGAGIDGAAFDIPGIFAVNGVHGPTVQVDHQLGSVVELDCFIHRGP
ncbi:hypothetical protein D3C75_1087970 [compost metagenome]